MNIKYLLLMMIMTAITIHTHGTHNKQLTKGILIAIEGIDGSGKSTLARALYNALQQENFDTILTREPGDSALGKEIRELVQTQTIPISSFAEFLLFAADRAQHFAELIIPALEQNKLIISDRMADSSLAYQGYGRGLELQALRTINSWAMNKIQPHLTIFIRIPIGIALERCRKRSTLSVFEQEQFLEKVARGFEEIYCNRNDVIIVDGAESLEYLTAYIYNAIQEWIRSNNLFS